MPIDPAAGYSLDPDQALRERLRELERGARFNPGRQSGGGFDPTVIGYAAGVPNAGAGVYFYGPQVALTIPEPGAFVAAYMELELRATAGSGAGAHYNAQARIVDDKYINSGGADPDNMFYGPALNWTLSDKALENPGGPGAFPTPWYRSAQHAEPYTAGGVTGFTPPGVEVVQFMTPGPRVFQPYLRSFGGAGSAMEYRNVRLMVRVIT